MEKEMKSTYRRVLFDSLSRTQKSQHLTLLPWGHFSIRDEFATWNVYSFVSLHMPLVLVHGQMSFIPLQEKKNLRDEDEPDK